MNESKIKMSGDPNFLIVGLQWLILSKMNQPSLLAATDSFFAGFAFVMYIVSCFWKEKKEI